MRCLHPRRGHQRQRCLLLKKPLFLFFGCLLVFPLRWAVLMLRLMLQLRCVVL